MLLELEVRDFAIIERMRVRLGTGFSVLTGETGAGKSIIVDAVGQLLGERADTTMIRAGAETALIEGVFDPGPGSKMLDELLDEYGVESGPELILRREIHAAGRSSARINGRAVPVRALAEMGERLVDIHGQSESASLKREAEHVELLDRFAGLEEERSQLAQLVSEERDVLAELARLQRDEAELARRAALLAYQVEEIEAADLSTDEEDRLHEERLRLVNSEKLATLADGAYRALRGGDTEPGSALDGMAEAVALLDQLTEIDPSLEPRKRTVAGSLEALTEVASRLLDYRDALEFDPARLDEIENRLAGISDLKRKYGPDVEAVLQYAADAAEELVTLTSAEERIEVLSQQREQLLARIGKVAETLSDRRRMSATELAQQVEAEMESLGIPGSTFEVSLERQADPNGVPVGDERLAYDATGVDRVAFQVSTNPGEPARPLVRVASGGETARLMLALKRILITADRTPTLVFDEIDAGIGGRVGAVVGKKLWELALRHQVFCVTHLPQVAAYADNHYHVRKQVADGRTEALLAQVKGDDRVSELTSMLGTRTAVARESALQLLQQSEVWKATRKAPRADD